MNFSRIRTERPKPTYLELRLNTMKNQQTINQPNDRGPYAPFNPTHSPLPWHHRIETPHTRCAVTDYGHLEICEVYGIDRDTRNANAAYIVRACNNAERLAEALRDMLGNPTKSQWDNAHGALAQWEAGL